MATLNEYRSKFRLLSKQEVIAEHRELFETIIDCKTVGFFLKISKESRVLEYAKIRTVLQSKTIKVMRFSL